MTHPYRARPARNPVIVFSEEFNGWGVLLDPGSGAALELNPVGVVVWTLMDGRRSLDEIVAGVRDRCEGVPDGFAEDVSGFVGTLVKRGLVQWGSKE